MCASGGCLGGWLELVWDRGLGLTEAVGQLWCADPALVCTIKVGQGWLASSGVHRPLTESCSRSPACDGVVALDLLYSS